MRQAASAAGRSTPTRVESPDDPSRKASASAGGATTLSGSADVYAASELLSNYSAIAPPQVNQQWPNPVSFNITTDSQGRVINASQVWKGPTTTAHLSIHVTGYVSPPVTAPGS